MRNKITLGILLVATLLCGCSGTTSELMIKPANIKETSSSSVSVNTVPDSDSIIDTLCKTDRLKEHLKDAEAVNIKTCREGEVYYVDEYHEEGGWIIEKECTKSSDGDFSYTTTRYKDNISIGYYITDTSNEVIFRAYKKGDDRVITEDHPIIFTDPFYNAGDIQITDTGKENDSDVYTVHNKVGSSTLYIDKTGRVYRITDKFNTIYVEQQKYPFERDPVKEAQGNNSRNIIIHCDGEDYNLSVRNDIPFEVWCMEEDGVENEKHLFLDSSYTKPCSKVGKEGDLELWITGMGG